MYDRKNVLKYIEKEQDFLNTTVKENIEKYFMRDKTTLAQDAEKAAKAKEEKK